jgi:hypothetical protein
MATPEVEHGQDALKEYNSKVSANVFFTVDLIAYLTEQ